MLAIIATTRITTATATININNKRKNNNDNNNKINNISPMITLIVGDISN